jgi:hypothetical protein
VPHQHSEPGFPSLMKTLREAEVHVHHTPLRTTSRLDKNWTVVGETGSPCFICKSCDRRTSSGLRFRDSFVSECPVRRRRFRASCLLKNRVRR